MLRSLIKGMQRIDQVCEVINDAKSVKEGKGVQTLGGKILKKKANKKIMKMFK
ncbi:hypothetical protein [Anaerobacillus alkalilacustris]|uniref:hypothetical protein n=1 Tax=Anaerobacillus alkalilacustris TaxID=393763 RepID=UPI0014720AC7|nr:hypothetical protein [Anaerobacillus alkalilacustris]